MVESLIDQSELMTGAIGALIGFGSKGLWTKIQVLRARRKNGIWPLNVHLEQDPEIVWANMPPWVSAPVFLSGVRDPSDLVPDRSGALGLFKWGVENHNGVPAGSSTIQLTVRSEKELEIIFDSLRVHAERYDPGPGCIVLSPVGGASLEKRRFELFLSDFGPEVKAVEPGGSEVKEFQAMVRPLDPLRINLDARFAEWSTDAKGYKWHATCDLLVEGTRKSIRIPQEKGRFFRIVNDRFYDTFLWNGSEWSAEKRPST